MHQETNKRERGVKRVRGEGGEGGEGDTSCSLVRPVHGPHSFLNLIIGPHAHQALTENHASACSTTNPEPAQIQQHTT